MEDAAAADAAGGSSPPGARATRATVPDELGGSGARRPPPPPLLPRRGGHDDGDDGDCGENNNKKVETEEEREPNHGDNDSNDDNDNALVRQRLRAKHDELQQRRLELLARRAAGRADVDALTRGAALCPAARPLLHATRGQIAVELRALDAAARKQAAQLRALRDAAREFGAPDDDGDEAEDDEEGEEDDDSSGRGGLRRTPLHPPPPPPPAGDGGPPAKRGKRAEATACPLQRFADQGREPPPGLATDALARMNAEVARALGLAGRYPDFAARETGQHEVDAAFELRGLAAPEHFAVLARAWSRRLSSQSSSSSSSSSSQSPSPSPSPTPPPCVLAYKGRRTGGTRLACRVCGGTIERAFFVRPRENRFAKFHLGCAAFVVGTASSPSP